MKSMTIGLLTLGLSLSAQADIKNVTVSCQNQVVAGRTGNITRAEANLKIDEKTGKTTGVVKVSIGGSIRLISTQFKVVGITINNNIEGISDANAPTIIQVTKKGAATGAGFKDLDHAVLLAVGADMNQTVTKDSKDQSELSLATKEQVSENKADTTALTCKIQLK